MTPFSAGGGNEPLVTLGLPSGARADIYQHGAQVASWASADGQERLFLSRSARYGAGSAIRGGIPICFPQFSGLGNLPKHGFARTVPWDVLPAARPASASFGLQDSEATRAIWPHPFNAVFQVSLAERSLELALTITNNGPSAFEFTGALHTYLRVGDLSAVQILGLQDQPCYDQLTRQWLNPPGRGPLAIDSEIDRLYPDVNGEVVLKDQDRELKLTQSGFRDVVVWNPWSQKGNTISDMETDGYRHFVCIEAALASRPVTLLPGGAWYGAQRLFF
jgi:glucose-6-phosphate 1-epimerase